MTEYEKKCIYIRVAENKTNIYKFLSKQRLNFSAVVLKMCQGDIALWASGRQDFENLQCFFGAGQISDISKFGKGHCIFSFASIQPG